MPLDEFFDELKTHQIMKSCFNFLEKPEQSIDRGTDDRSSFDSQGITSRSERLTRARLQQSQN